MPQKLAWLSGATSASLSRTGTSSPSAFGRAAVAPCSLVELHQLGSAAFVFQFVLHNLTGCE